MVDASNRVARVFISRMFAVSLLIVLLGFLVLGSLLPDSGTGADPGVPRSPQETVLSRLSDALHVQRLVSSPVFLVLPVLIFLSTLICTYRRLSHRTRREGGFTHEASARASLPAGEIAELLLRQNWSVTVNGRSLVADKGAAGFWGSIVFHLGLLLVFLAVVISSLTRFNAELMLTEGFPVTLGKDAFAKIHRTTGIESLSPAVITLTQFIPSFADDRFSKDFLARITVDGRERELHVNRPFELDGFQFSLHRYGFAPSFRIVDQSGSEILNAVINLVVTDGAEDTFAIPGTSYEVRVRLFPDFVSDGATIGSRGPLPRNPVVMLRLMEGGRPVGSGRIRLRGTETIGGLTITFDGLHYWADLIVDRDYGLWIFGASFVLIVAGLSIRFSLPDKRLTVLCGDGAVTVTGWCKYYPSFFAEEVERLLAKIGAGTV